MALDTFIVLPHRALPATPAVEAPTRPTGRLRAPRQSGLPASTDRRSRGSLRPTPTITALTLRVQREYREMPGLSLTERQSRRLWDLDPQTCRRVLATLVAQRFLRRTADGTYVRRLS
ncbi:MAG: hypothetical protein AB7O67_04870 [Vicinamibacterales bacterium]